MDNMTDCHLAAINDGMLGAERHPVLGQVLVCRVCA